MQTRVNPRYVIHWWHEMKSQRVSIGFSLFRLRMSVQNLMAIHPTFVDVFQEDQRVDQQTIPYYLTIALRRLRYLNWHQTKLFQTYCFFALGFILMLPSQSFFDPVLLKFNLSLQDVFLLQNAAFRKGLYRKNNNLHGVGKKCTTRKVVLLVPA